MSDLTTFDQLSADESAEQVAEIEEWLQSLGVTMWADWNIQDPDRREGAAVWFLKQIHDFMDYFEGVD